MEIQTMGSLGQTFGRDTEFVKTAQTQCHEHDYVLSETAVTAAEVECRIVPLSIVSSLEFTFQSIQN
jgi:hypothetical protein